MNPLYVSIVNKITKYSVESERIRGAYVEQDRIQGGGEVYVTPPPPAYFQNALYCRVDQNCN